MAIIASELKMYKAVEMSDASTNGGRMSANEILDAIKNSIFPDIPESERTAGSTKHRKVFWKIANDADLDLQSPRFFMETFTAGQDRIYFFVATQRDQQSAITGSERKYGAGQLDANVIASASQITVATEAAADNVFQNGDTIRISDKTSVTDVGNNEEFHVITGVPTYAVDVATINIVGTLANGYTAASTRVASVYEPADVTAAFTSFVVTSSAGTYTTAGNLLMDHIGTVEQDWTITFTSPTAFNIVGDVVGSVGSGNISSDTDPNNPDFTKPYFHLDSVGFGGTFVAADTITFTTSPAATPLWESRVVPAGAVSQSNNNQILAITGASA